MSYLSRWTLCSGRTVCRGRRTRTTAGMQEVEQRRSSCRGAAISRLVALVPRPRVNLTRFHGVFAPNSKYRARVTPASPGIVDPPCSDNSAKPRKKLDGPPQGVKRVFNLEVETCDKCGGDARIIACIEDPAVIQKILTHLDNTASSAATALLPDCRASPSLSPELFD